jgi:GNAT superfamily N-acetyltransferase
MTATTPAAAVTSPSRAAIRIDDSPSSSLAVWVRQPWMLRVGDQNILIRGSGPRDLTALGAMHARCSPPSLLARYRAGGIGPSAAALDRVLRRPLSFVACTGRGEIVAAAVAAPDPWHKEDCAEAGLLVEDAWQRSGLGRELAAHLAGAAFVCGYAELIAYPATARVAAQRLATAIGRTRLVADTDSPHLHIQLRESTTLGLGAVREHLAS